MAQPARDPAGGRACRPHAYELLSTAVLLLDDRGEIVDVNTAAEELFGNSRRNLAGRQAADLLEADGALQAGLLDALAGRFGILRQALTVRRRDQTVPVNVAVVPLRCEPWAALMEVRVVEQHMLLERHEQLNKELAAQRETLRNLAHEVKNPLGGIRAAAQLLDSELTDPGLREYTAVVIAEADRLAHLVDRLVAPEGATLRRAPLNIHEICERVRTLVGAEFPAVEIRRDYDASLPELIGDFGRLLQAVLNIARNAAQALTEQPGEQAPRLVLRTRIARQALPVRHGARLAVVLALIDNGPGVPPEIFDKVFHPLVTGRAAGTGLGLSLAQELVQQHGGILECESRPGHTEFRLILPLEAR